MRQIRELRDGYQTDDARKILAALRQFLRVLYVLATGGGKTSILAYIVQQMVRSGRTCLVLVPSVELLEQTYKTLCEFGIPRRRIGIIWRNDSRRNDGADVFVATVATLKSRGIRPDVDYVFVDEAHHSVADIWSQILSWYGTKHIVGFTATPERLDGVSLLAVFETPILGAGVEDLINQGWLRAPRCFVSDRVDSRGRIRMPGRRTIACAPHVAIAAHAQDRSGVLFCKTVEHAELAAQQIRDARIGFACRVLTGQTRERVRRATLDPGGWLDSGPRRLVVTCDLLNEGYDLPSIKLVVLARYTASLALYLHQVGRCMRPHKVTLEGHEWSPMVVDLSGNVLRFGAPYEDRTWTLQRAATGPGAGPENGPIRGQLAKACPMCGEAVPMGAEQCPCGYRYPPSRRIPKARAWALRELHKMSQQKQATEWRAWYEARLATLRESFVEGAEEIARKSADLYALMRFGPGAE